MIQFLKANQLPLGIALLAIILPLIASTVLLYWVMLPLWAFSWMGFNWLKHQKAVVTDDRDLQHNQERLARLIDTYLYKLQSCVEQESNLVQTELTRLKSVVADAVVTMSNSFNSLHSLTSNQSTVVFSLVNDLDGASQTNQKSMSFAQFAEETDNVLSFFIEHILQISKQSMEMVGVINDVGNHMAHVEKLLGDVQKIADQTNLLALNAAIEAARAGEAGRGFAVVADEVRNLSKHSDKFSEEIKVVVNASKSNINQAQSMIEYMASKDMNVAISSKDTIDKMISDITVINDKVSRNINEISKLTSQIEVSVGNAVRGLQFEDMSRQVIEYLQQTVQHFQALNDEVNIGMAIFKAGNSESWQEQLQQGVDRLDDMKLQWVAKAPTKTVLQSSMEEGDVDLF